MKWEYQNPHRAELRLPPKNGYSRTVYALLTPQLTVYSASMDPLHGGTAVDFTSAEENASKALPELYGLLGLSPAEQAQIDESELRRMVQLLW